VRRGQVATMLRRRIAVEDERVRRKVDRIVQARRRAGRNNAS
jgi:hypothetical protein